jgi:hypothetical protein
MAAKYTVSRGCHQISYAAQDRMTGWDVSKMQASHSARYTSTTAFQSSTGYSRVWTEGYYVSSWQVSSIPRMDRHGRYQRVVQDRSPRGTNDTASQLGNWESLAGLARSYRQQKFTNFAGAARPTNFAKFMIFAERAYGPADARLFGPTPGPDNPIDTLRLFGRICCAMLADLRWRTRATIPERCKRIWVTGMSSTPCGTPG